MSNWPSRPIEAPVRRYGRFKVRGTELSLMDSRVLRILGQCAVLRAEHMFTQDAVEYVANSYHFRHLEPGEEIPEYLWEFDPEGHPQAIEVNERYLIQLSVKG